MNLNPKTQLAKVRPVAVWTLALLLLMTSTTVLAVRESGKLVLGLKEEMLYAVNDMTAAVADGDMFRAEREAMRFWRLAELEANTYLARVEGQQLQELAEAVSDAAAGWSAKPLQPDESRQVIGQLLNLRQMLLTGDYSQAKSVMVWIKR
jgi:hypothetical protein